MIKNRSTEIAVGITLSIVIALVLFYAEDENLKMDSIADSGITGFASYEQYAEHKELVIVSGTEFKADVDGEIFYYIFDDGKWYESKKDFEWEERVDMGKSIWSGLSYLKSYDAKIYFKGEEIKDITKFMREFR